jgi:hypothetical protein
MIRGPKVSNFKIEESNLQNNENRGSKLQLSKFNIDISMEVI